jgi:hypothetical protein
MIKDNAKMRTPALPGVLDDPVLNRGVAFSPAEREALGLTGRLPAAVLTLEEQAERAYWGVGGIQIAVGKPDLSRGGAEGEAADGILAAARFRDAPRAHRLAAACAGLACVVPKSPGPALAHYACKADSGRPGNPKGSCWRPRFVSTRSEGGRCDG